MAPVLLLCGCHSHTLGVLKQQTFIPLQFEKPGVQSEGVAWVALLLRTLQGILPPLIPLLVVPGVPSLAAA